MVQVIHSTGSRTWAALLIAVFVLTSNTLVCGQQSVERKQLFDNNWKFFLGDTAAASTSGFDDRDWRNVQLPHDWSIEGRVHPKNPTGVGGGYFPAGIGWYRKTFTAPAVWKDKKVRIYFEGIYMNAEVFVNGKSVGVQPYGYSSFSYDLSPFLEAGQQNVVAVRVDNSLQKNSRWYSGSGIYRHVWIMVTDPLHVAQWGVGITTPEVTAKAATVRITTLIQNETSAAQKVTVKTSIRRGTAGPVGAAQQVVQIPANSEQQVEQVIKVSNPLLWSPDRPQLYAARVELMTEKKLIDEVSTDFGIRSLSFSSVNGFLLNGKQVKINGGCVHHDNGCLGAAAFDRAEERKVELLKSAGFNAVRTSHNPPSEAFLNACDRLGILVMDEAFDCWRIGKNPHDYGKYFDSWWKKDLEAMVRRDRNHPSIFMWSIGNEIVERADPPAVETARMLAATIKSIDTSRPVTSAVNGNDKEWSVFDPLFGVHEVAGYNYHLNTAPADHERVPSRIIVHTESFPRDAFFNWKLVQDNSYIIGDFVWTAMDYLGESGIGRSYYTGQVPGEHWENEFFPWHGAYCGDIDLIGWRKPISHYRNLLYNSNEKLYLAVREPQPEPLEIKETLWSVWPTWESWTWPGYEGRTIDVEVYSRYPQVRLYLNGSLIGEKATGIEQRYKATFNIQYVSGELKAVGVVNDREVESATLRTAGAPAGIKATADRSEIIANGQDLCYVAVELADVNGTIQPNSANRLEFRIEGPGVIAGVDNADLQDYDPYVSAERRAWHGRALVVIRSTNVAGDVRLFVTSPGLKEAELHIKTIAEKTKPGINRVD